MFYEQGLGAYFSNIYRAIFPGNGNQAENSYYLTQNLLGTKNPIWIDTQRLWEVYTGIPHLNTIINKRAELLSLGKIRMRKIDTQEEVFKHDALTLLRKPNPLQSFSEFITQYCTFKDIYGNAVLYKNNRTIGSVPAFLWNLPPHLIQIKPTGKIFNQTKLEDIISGYTLTLAGNVTEFLPSEILLKNDNVGSEYLKSQSKILSLIKPLSNIAGAMKTANVMINDHGAYGAISNDSKDSDGGIPLAEAERLRIEKSDRERYGNKDGQSRRIITTASIKYTPMSFPIKEMMLFEEVEQDFGQLLDAYGVDRDIFASVKGATDENKEMGLKSTIQNSIQPEANDFCESLNSDWGISDEGLELFISYDHLPVMQENSVQAAQARLYEVQSVQILKQMGLILPEQAAKIAGVVFDGTGVPEVIAKSVVDPSKIDLTKK